MTAIFVNFRNGDDNYAAGLLYLELAAHLGESRVFRSTDSLRAGQEWERQILGTLSRSDVVLVVIGRSWLDARDERGRRRLWLRHDWVRREIALALRDGKEVIPVLLDGRDRLKAAELPPSIRDLARRQSVRLDHRRLRADLAGLVHHIGSRPDFADQGPTPPPSSPGCTPRAPSTAKN
ncbi:toll/interleukin-1 receptor domain-containing protein [Amycolatopsis sp. Hca4]|uniref:toll/interleukin-1 receptor domain-containing protein n=1 Tax=Amycolatopsis sp. Hca4 TaxID=2742131 RepID=UPI00159051B5|nr:toll/interleukin-1 receptor domain-containing protein [Amycolatopsis sp. Hca4]QKV74882.1 toll/interleukin-1 receptor domain-containing protein [Amycolatopsis sp. Hca4]